MTTMVDGQRVETITELHNEWVYRCVIAFHNGHAWVRTQIKRVGEHYQDTEWENYHSDSDGFVTPEWVWWLRLKFWYRWLRKDFDLPTAYDAADHVFRLRMNGIKLTRIQSAQAGSR